MFEQALQPLAPELLWILCLGLLIAFILAFSVGANDVSNSFGTSVGSRVLTVTQACMLATFFEVAGATLLGYTVCDTFRIKMYDLELYKDSQKELMLGALACLIGSASWNILATALKMPISGTHSIVGATIGFSIVSRGWASIKWYAMLRIVISWFASPIMSGLISSIIYVLISKTIIRKVDPLKYGLKALPLFYGATIFINVASIVIDGPNVLSLNELSWYAGLFISLVIAGGAICLVAMVLVPRLRDRILDELITKKSRPPPAAGSLPAHVGIITQQKPITTSTFVEKGAAETAFDNVAFKPDIGSVGDKQLAIAAPPTPGDAKKELTLSADQLMLEPSSVKPPIAPKPPHLCVLKRQNAQDLSQQQQQQELEEIDLSGTGATGGTDLVEKPKRHAHTKGFAAGDSKKSKLPKQSNSLDRPGLIDGERLEVFRLFSSLQIMTACFASFAHGTNDVSNAVAPLIPIWNIYSTGREDVNYPTQVWILAFGGIGICTGLWAWGRAVMKTVGEGLTKLTPSKGFAIELGAAISVLCATKLGLPISTTHCKVGSVVIVGLIDAKFCSQDNLLDRCDDEESIVGEGKKRDKVQPVDWKLFGNIALTWIATVPLAGAASALMMVILRWLAL